MRGMKTDARHRSLLGTVNKIEASEFHKVRSLMKLFSCRSCSQVVYFENEVCERCGSVLGFDAGVNEMLALKESSTTRDAASGAGDVFCRNREYHSCNWLVCEKGDYCKACRHNGTVPNLTDPAHVIAWMKIEVAKHRLFYSLLRWRLPLKTRLEDPQHGLVFHFLADPPTGAPKVMTGHDNGVITIALAEADDAERERRRTAMGEPYRTLLGHFRHEVGHHFWDILVNGTGHLKSCRELFGDEREDYSEALQRHYEQGPPQGWQERYVSAYATTHPWEDFAETWAHYLHVVDTLETASAFGVHVSPAVDRTGIMQARIDFDPYRVQDMQDVIKAWLPLTFALNSLNRSMGLSDLYPFILSAAVTEKLKFIHALIAPHWMDGAARP